MHMWALRPQLVLMQQLISLATLAGTPGVLMLLLPVPLSLLLVLMPRLVSDLLLKVTL